jgi:hypothetical protein
MLPITILVDDARGECQRNPINWIVLTWNLLVNNIQSQFTTQPLLGNRNYKSNSTSNQDLNFTPRLTRFVYACELLGIREQLGRDWLYKKVFPIPTVKINGLRLVSNDHLKSYIYPDNKSWVVHLNYDEIPISIPFKIACLLLGVSYKLGRNWLHKDVFPVETRKVIGQRVVDIKVLNSYIDKLLNITENSDEHEGRAS